MQVKLYKPIKLFETIGKVLKSKLVKKISAFVKIDHLLPKTHFRKKKNASIKYAIQY